MFCRELVSPFGLFVSAAIFIMFLHDDYYHWKMSPSDIEKADEVCGLYQGAEWKKSRRISGFYVYTIDYVEYRFLFRGKDIYHKHLQGLVGEEVCFYYYDELYSDSVLKYLFYFESGGRRFIDREFSIASYMEYKHNALYGASVFIALLFLMAHVFCYRNDVGDK